MQQEGHGGASAGSLVSLLRPPPPVRRWSNLFAVEPTGVVWSLDRPGERVRPIVRADGVRVLPGSRTPLSHIVASLWVPNKSGTRRVIHRDGNPGNNAAANLQWK